MPKVFIYLQKLNSNSNNMKYWLFPGNKNRFRLDDFINDYGFIEWNPLRYRNHIQVGDIVFIYVGAPSKRICYQMSVEKVNIPFNEQKENLILYEKHFFVLEVKESCRNVVPLRCS